LSARNISIVPLPEGSCQKAPALNKLISIKRGTSASGQTVSLPDLLIVIGQVPALIAEALHLSSLWREKRLQSGNLSYRQEY
jgi:hypothetical protein